MNGIKYHIDHLADIRSPTLVMYSPNDRAVSPKNAQRVCREVKNCELYEVGSDSQLIWIGKSASELWKKRLMFLQS